ncbi:MAG: hypothetical protein Q8R28_15215 [Dehalococcoidia bacterium]|nr:hypothetical protein [Dehalococcoidia bacterium]
MPKLVFDPVTKRMTQVETPKKPPAPKKQEPATGGNAPPDQRPPRVPAGRAAERPPKVPQGRTVADLGLKPGDVVRLAGMPGRYAMEDGHGDRYVFRPADAPAPVFGVDGAAIVDRVEERREPSTSSSSSSTPAGEAAPK